MGAGHGKWALDNFPPKTIDFLEEAITGKAGEDLLSQPLPRNRLLGRDFVGGQPNQATAHVALNMRGCRLKALGDNFVGQTEHK